LYGVHPRFKAAVEHGPVSEITESAG